MGNMPIECNFSTRAETPAIEPTSCDRWQSCNAPICPLDLDMPKRSYRDGEPVCIYLGEYAKPTSRPFLRGAIGERFYLRLALAYPKVFEAYGPLRKRLRRASGTPSRLFRITIAELER